MSSSRAPSPSAYAAGRLAALYRLLGRPHVLDILHTVCAERGPVRFVELQRRLGVSPNTLAERLRDLVQAGLLTRSAHREIPPRVDYAPTPKAQELGTLFDGLTAWSRRHQLVPEG
jgi:DNA-binding HxlR family transcriptional regulator